MLMVCALASNDSAPRKSSAVAMILVVLCIDVSPSREPPRWGGRSQSFVTRRPLGAAPSLAFRGGSVAVPLIICNAPTLANRQEEIGDELLFWRNARITAADIERRPVVRLIAAGGEPFAVKLL